MIIKIYRTETTRIYSHLFIHLKYKQLHTFRAANELLDSLTIFNAHKKDSFFDFSRFFHIKVTVKREYYRKKMYLARNVGSSHVTFTLIQCTVRFERDGGDWIHLMISFYVLWIDNGHLRKELIAKSRTNSCKTLTGFPGGNHSIIHTNFRIE